MRDFGIPVVEAMSCKTPVIVSDRSSLPEVAQDAALYVDPTNVEDISAQIFKVVQDKNLQNQLKEKALLQVQKFSWENSAQVIYQAFETSLDQVR